MFRRLLIKLNGSKDKTASPTKTLKAAAASKPQGVKKTKANGAKGTRGRQKKVVQGEMASDADEGDKAEEVENGGEWRSFAAGLVSGADGFIAEVSAVEEEKSEEAGVGIKGEAGVKEEAEE